MTPNPILKVLSTLGSHRVRYLLIGGQACVFYGGAEFSRDTDIAVLAEELEAQQRQQREADRSYWVPLRAELEQLRRGPRGS